jgi:hypothetical protein
MGFLCRAKSESEEKRFFGEIKEARENEHVQ